MALPTDAMAAWLQVSLLAVVAALAAAQAVSLPSHATAESSPTLAVPLPVGEELEYDIRWADFLNAATAQLVVAERRAFFGYDVWHFRAVASTLGLVRLFYPLDDQFDSYVEAAGLASLQFEKYLHERGSREDSVIRMSPPGGPVPGNHPAVRVPAGTRDPLAMIYYLRSVNWSRTPEVRTPVHDGRKLYDVRSRLESESAAIRVAGHNFTAAKIAIRVFEQGQEVPSTRFWLWLAHDRARTPVLIEAELPVGSLRAELRSEQQ